VQNRNDMDSPASHGKMGSARGPRAKIGGSPIFRGGRSASRRAEPPKGGCSPQKILKLTFQKHHGPAGIALLELMLAAAILGVALIGLGIAVGRCVRGLSAANHLEAALDATEQRFEEWRKEAATATEIKEETTSGEMVIHDRTFTWTQVVEATEDNKAMKLALTIVWLEGEAPRERTFVALVLKSPKKTK